jgi:hypothetical protein
MCCFHLYVASIMVCVAFIGMLQSVVTCRFRSLVLLGTISVVTSTILINASLADQVLKYILQ